MHPQVESLDEFVQQLESIMHSSPGYIFLKDVKGNYLFQNQHLQKLSGGSLVGHNDTKAPWQQFAELYMQGDQHLIQNCSCINKLEPLQDHNKKVVIIHTHKAPVHINNELVGIMGNLQLMPKKNVTFAEQLLPDSAFVDTNRQQQLNLTHRQAEVLYELLSGSTAREAASKLFFI